MIDRFDADAVASAYHQGRGRLIAGIGGAHGGHQQTIVRQLIAVEDDPDLARGALRDTVGFLADLPGNGASLRRTGFTDDDITTRSDRLVDGVTGWGSVDRVAARLRAHLDAGADQVMIDEAAFAAGIDTRRLGG